MPMRISVSAEEVRAFSAQMSAMIERVARQFGTFAGGLPRAASAWSSLADGLALDSMKAAGHLGPDVMAACADRAWQMQNTVPLGLVDVETGVPWVHPRRAVIIVYDQEGPR